jgi:hypothetical protein
MPCPTKVKRRFRKTCRSQLQGRRVCQTRNQHEAGNKHGRLCFDPEDGGQMLLQNLSFHRTAQLMFQNTELFIATAVKTSNPAKELPNFELLVRSSVKMQYEARLLKLRPLPLSTAHTLNTWHV